MLAPSRASLALGGDSWTDTSGVSATSRSIGVPSCAIAWSRVVTWPASETVMRCAPAGTDVGAS